MENKIEKIEIHANNVMDEILSKNRNTFDIFKGSLKEIFGVEPERIYIPETMTGFAISFRAYGK